LKPTLQPQPRTSSKLLVFAFGGQLIVSQVQSVGLRIGHGFALYECSNDLERSLHEEENICDIISKWDQYKQLMSVHGLSGWKLVFMFLTALADFAFFFKKQVYLSPQTDPSDPGS
jgi:hypothetical protein